MSIEREVSREEVKTAIGELIKIMDSQAGHENPLLGLEGSFQPAEELTISFKRKVERQDSELEPISAKSIITCKVNDLNNPIFKAEVRIISSIPPYDSEISFHCRGNVAGYSIFDEDDFGNFYQYRFFSNDPAKGATQFRNHLEQLSKDLSR